MIFFNPIILASEFITHTIVIVLIGIEIVVYVHNRGFKGVDDRSKRDAFNWVVTITALGALWLLAEVFGIFGISYFIFVRFLIIAVIIAVVIYHSFLSFRHHTIVSNSSAIWFSVFASIFILSDIVYVYLPTPITAVFYAVSRIAAILAYYFFLMSYLVKINHEN